MERYRSMRTILFHNPNAGVGDHADEELLAALRLAGLDVYYCSTKSADFKKGLKREAELVVVAGGDGTVIKVLTQWPDRNVPIGIIPLGTANNIATALGIAGEAEELAPRWSPEHTRPLDIGVATGPWGKARFIEAIGFGALARSTDKKIGAKSDGEKRLLVGRDAFRQALIDMEPQDPGLIIDGQSAEGDLLAVEILNIGYTGPRLPLSPSANPGDGLLDVACIRPEQRDEVLEWLAAPEERAPVPLTVVQARKVSFTWSGKEALRIDDDFPARPKLPQTVEVELERQNVKILVPQPRENCADQSRQGKELEEQ